MESSTLNEVMLLRNSGVLRKLQMYFYIMIHLCMSANVSVTGISGL